MEFIQSVFPRDLGSELLPKEFTFDTVSSFNRTVPKQADSVEVARAVIDSTQHYFPLSFDSTFHLTSDV